MNENIKCGQTMVRIELITNQYHSVVVGVISNLLLAAQRSLREIVVDSLRLK